MRKTKNQAVRTLAGVAIAASLALTPLLTGAAVAPAGPPDVGTFATTQAQGNRTCGPSQQVRVSVTLDGPGRVYYARYINGRWTDVGTTGVYQYGHLHDYAARTVQWKVISSGAGIASVSDGCV